MLNTHANFVGSRVENAPGTNSDTSLPGAHIHVSSPGLESLYTLSKAGCSLLLHTGRLAYIGPENLGKARQGGARRGKARRGMARRGVARRG